MAQPELTVVCSKWGTQYGPEYVDRLHGMVEEHLTLPHRFVCFTDSTYGIDGGIDCFPLEPMWAGKDLVQLHQRRGGISAGYPNLYLFRKDFPFTGRVLYLDLDVVITGSLDELVQQEGPFWAIKDWWAHNWNGSVTLFEAGFRPQLWDEFPPKDLDSLGNGQHWLSRYVPDGQAWPDAWVRSYKIHCQGMDSYPDDCRVVVFHGEPKPDQVPDAWVHDNWYGRKVMQ